MNENIIECQVCEFAVATDEIVRYSSDAIPLPDQVVIEEYEINTTHDEYILRCCPKCKSPFLIKHSYFNHFEAGSYIQDEVLLYPSGSGEALSLGAIPAGILRIYSQSKSCFSNGLYEPSVIMARKCLEAVCRDLGATGRNLSDKVESLSNSNKIDKRLHSWATELRLIGNDAAHDLDVKITKRDAQDSLAFLNAMLLYIYTLEKKFSEFLRRRGKA